MDTFDRLVAEHGWNTAYSTLREQAKTDAKHVEFALELMREDGVRLISEAVFECSQTEEDMLQAALSSENRAELGRIVLKLTFNRAMFETDRKAENWKADALSRVLESDRLARAERMGFEV